MEFRTRIKELCQQNGMTQRMLAEKMGITDISLNKTLRGEYPQLQTLERIANTLGVPIAALFGEYHDTKTPELTALIKLEDKCYQASSISELEAILEDIRRKTSMRQPLSE